MSKGVEGKGMEIAIPNAADIQSALAQLESQDWEMSPEDRRAMAASITLKGDYSLLTETQQAVALCWLCHQDGVDPIGQPWILSLTNGKLVLQATKNRMHQKLAKHPVQFTKPEIQFIGDGSMFVIGMSAETPGKPVAHDILAGTTAGFAVGESKANQFGRTITRLKKRLVSELFPSLVESDTWDESDLPGTPNDAAQATTISGQVISADPSPVNGSQALTVRDMVNAIAPDADAEKAIITAAKAAAPHGVPLIKAVFAERKDSPLSADEVVALIQTIEAAATAPQGA